MAPLTTTALFLILLPIGIHLAAAASIHGNMLGRRGGVPSSIIGEDIFDQDAPWVSKTCRLGLIDNKGIQWGSYPFGRGDFERPSLIDGERAKAVFESPNRAGAWLVPEQEWRYNYIYYPEYSKSCLNIQDAIGENYGVSGLGSFFIAGYCYCHFFYKEDCDSFNFYFPQENVSPSDVAFITHTYIGASVDKIGLGKFEAWQGDPFKSFVCFRTAPQPEPQFTHTKCSVAISNGGDKDPRYNEMDGVDNTLKIERTYGANSMSWSFNLDPDDPKLLERERGRTLILPYTGQGTCVQVSDSIGGSPDGISMRQWSVKACTCLFYPTDHCKGRPVVIDGHNGHVERTIEDWGPATFYERQKIRSFRCNAPYGPPAPPDYVRSGYNFGLRNQSVALANWGS
ncbi:hypothetical protein TWF481_001334 [Arthrobotrys musiformis]|uniref:Uncharacterized protein n=1 Tax=Arthrobotrys musiformis TaxID=47236 RepID=A0AAV9WQ73_9PEZI